LLLNLGQILNINVMNKLFFILLFALTLGACKNESKELKAADEATKEMVPADTLNIATAPSFSNPAAQEYVVLYDAFLANYIDAVRAKDNVKLQELSTQMVTLSSKGVEALKNLSGEEAIKMTEYMKLKSEEFAKIAAETK
jgi:hypothetical protein